MGGVNPLNPSHGSPPEKEIKSESNQSQLGYREKLYLKTFVHLRWTLVPGAIKVVGRCLHMLHFHCSRQNGGHDCNENFNSQFSYSGTQWIRGPTAIQIWPSSWGGHLNRVAYVSPRNRKRRQKTSGQNIIETNEIQCTVIISIPLVKDHLTFLLFKVL